MRTCLAINNREHPSIVVESCLDHLERFRKVIRDAAVTIGCCADFVYLISEKDFVYALDRFKKFNNFHVIAAATTEFEIINEKLWTATFVNAENSLAQEYPKGVIAHEFAHIRQCYNLGGMPKLLFEKSCPRDARDLATLFLMEAEEVAADSLLPSSWRNSKNRAILRYINAYPEEPHPFFLAALKATTNFRKEDAVLFKRLNDRINANPMLSFLFEMGLQYFRRFYTRKETDPKDVSVIEEGINKILKNLCGIADQCHITLRACWKRFNNNGRSLLHKQFDYVY